MSKRIFYVVYFDDKRLQNTLDAMRFIANPREKTRAHITIRGPYLKSRNVYDLERKIFGTEAVADGVKAFFSENQNTVFISCYSERFREVWNKKDFGFNPHITIYDGASREFAKMLFDRLERLPIRFSFLVGKLSSLVSHKDQYSTWLRESFDKELVSDIVGQSLTTFQIDELSSEQRVSLIESFVRWLPEFCTSPSNVLDSVKNSSEGR